MKICLISSSFFWNSSKNLFLLTSYVSYKLNGFLRVSILEAHLLQLTAAVQLIVPAVGLLSQILHVESDHHLPQLHNVTVGFIFRL